MSRFSLILVGIISFSIVAIATMPARIAYSFFNSPDNKIQLQDISGTIWNGQANRLQTLGHSLSTLKWQLHFVDMLLGDITLDVQISDSDYPLTSTVTRSFGGEIRAKDLKAILPASILRQLPYGSLVSLNGLLNINMPNLTLSDNNLTSAQGKISLADGQFLAPIQGTLGNLQFQISNKDDDILITMNDQQAPIGINGTLRLKPKHLYSFKGSFSPRANADAFLVTMVKNAARQQPDGSFLIQSEGRY